MWSVLAGVGRDGLVLWTMSFFFCYSLFYHHMKRRIKKVINRSLLLLSVPFSILFMMITISRFQFGREGKYSGTLESILYYFGMEFINFNKMFNGIDSYRFHSYLDLFPLLRYVTGYANKMDIFESSTAYIGEYHIDVYSFSTFIGHAWLCLDTYALLFLSVIYCLVFSSIYYKIGRNKKMPFNMLILYTFIAQIPLHGLFYYKLGYVVSNIYMINIIIMFFVFRDSRLRRNSVVK